MRGRKSPLVIALTPAEKAELESILRRTTVQAGLARRARIILLLAEGRSITATAREVQDQRWIVRQWGRRYLQKRLKGLFDAPRPGRRPVFSPRSRHAGCEAGLRDAGFRWAVPLAVGLPGTGS